MNEATEHMAMGLVLHFLHGGTIEEAVSSGREAGLPEEFLNSFPGMMFEATSAACAVSLNEKTVDQVLDTLVERGAPRKDVEILVRAALEFIRSMGADGGDAQPVPHSKKPWYAYQGE
jgi:hypothetical protein